MSTPERDQVVEAKSSIKVIRNAKGDAQFEAKVVHGVTDDELAALRRQAVDTFHSLSRELAAGGAA